MTLARVRTVWLGTGGGDYVNTSYWTATPFGTTEAQAAVDAMRDFWTALAGNMASSSTATVLGQVDLLQTSPPLLIGQLSVTPRSVTCTGSGDQLPRMSQGLLRLETGTFINGHRVRGHWNIPRAMETANDPGAVPSAAYLATLQSAANTLNAIANPILSVYSRRNAVAIDVSGVTAVAKWAILRSRRD